MREETDGIDERHVYSGPRDFRFRMALEMADDKQEAWTSDVTGMGKPFEAVPNWRYSAMIRKYRGRILKSWLAGDFL